MTIAQAFNEIAVAQGGTASKSGTITGAIDALNDALAGSDQQAASTIEDAVRLLGANIGGGGEGGGGSSTEYNVVCYEYAVDGETAEIGDLTQVPSFVYETEWREDSDNPGYYGWWPKLDSPVDKAAAGTLLSFNEEVAPVYYSIEDFMNDNKSLPQQWGMWVMPSHGIVCCIEKQEDDDSPTLT